MVGLKVVGGNNNNMTIYACYRETQSGKTKCNRKRNRKAHTKDTNTGSSRYMYVSNLFVWVSISKFSIMNAKLMTTAKK